MPFGLYQNTMTNGGKSLKMVELNKFNISFAKQKINLFWCFIGSYPCECTRRTIALKLNTPHDIKNLHTCAGSKKVKSTLQNFWISFLAKSRHIISYNRRKMMQSIRNHSLIFQNKNHSEWHIGEHQAICKNEEINWLKSITSHQKGLISEFYYHYFIFQFWSIR